MPEMIIGASLMLFFLFYSILIFHLGGRFARKSSPPIVSPTQAPALTEEEVENKRKRENLENALSKVFQYKAK
jgi:hypothetical protein